LTGGGALAGFHTKHRETRDLDLFFHHRRELGSLVVDATGALQQAGLGVAPVRSSATFAQLDVRLDAESTIEALERFCHGLVERVMAEARPSDPT